MKELNEISKENPFRVPEGYFDNLTGRMTAAAKTEGRVMHLAGKRAFSLRPLILAAASVALLAIAGYVLFNNFTSSKEKALTADNNTFNNVYINDIDINTLEENVSSGSIDLRLPEVSRNDIVDFLSAEEVSIFDIYEQL